MSLSSTGQRHSGALRRRTVGQLGIGDGGPTNPLDAPFLWSEAVKLERMDPIDQTRHFMIAYRRQVSNENQRRCVNTEPS